MKVSKMFKAYNESYSKFLFIEGWQKEIMSFINVLKKEAADFDIIASFVPNYERDTHKLLQLIVKSQLKRQ